MGKQYINKFGNQIVFGSGEFEKRINKTKAKMVDNKIDLLLISSPANQFYLTGYDGWSFYTPQMVILSLDHKQPIWIGRAMDAVGAKFTAYIDKKNIIPYEDKYVASNKYHSMNFVVDFIKKKNGTRKQ